MKLCELINRDIDCVCGKTHRCDIKTVRIEKGALEKMRLQMI